MGLHIHGNSKIIGQSYKIKDVCSISDISIHDNVNSTLDESSVCHHVF